MDNVPLLVTVVPEVIVKEFVVVPVAPEMVKLPLFVMLQPDAFSVTVFAAAVTEPPIETA